MTLRLIVNLAVGLAAVLVVMRYGMLPWTIALGIILLVTCGLMWWKMQRP